MICRTRRAEPSSSCLNCNIHRTIRVPATPDRLSKTLEENESGPESVLWNGPVGLRRREEVAGARASGEASMDGRARERRGGGRGALKDVHVIIGGVVITVVVLCCRRCCCCCCSQNVKTLACDIMWVHVLLHNKPLCEPLSTTPINGSGRKGAAVGVQEDHRCRCTRPPPRSR